MKKIWIFIISIIPLLSITSCNDKDEIRDDINALNARLDKLQPEIDQLNENIATFYSLVNGKILFTGYVYDELTGNYTLNLSDGSSWTVYGGKPEHGIPVVTIQNGRWVFEYNGETKDLGSALPTDGKDGVAPKMKIDDEGYWCYSIDGSEWVRVPGPYNIATVGNIKPSIFEEVKPKDGDADVLSFKLYGESEYVDVPVLGGLDIVFSADVTVEQGKTATYTATLTNVEQVVIAPSPLKIELTDTADNNLSVSASSTLEAGCYPVYFEIYSKQGYRLVKELKVTVKTVSSTNI